MTIRTTNKRKILNDPIYGFITLRYDIVHDLIDHPWFQRLRRITQLGLSHLVYPGAIHNRFHHAIGAMHLMHRALDELRKKGTEITDEEFQGATIAILLHDIGHGPFSHALEHSFVEHISHEEIGAMMMERLNEVFDGALTTAIAIFRGAYPKQFLHELVSSQLDMDRLDYLRRDSFYTGVTEGQVGSERIIKMLDVVDDQLVVEQKGIYSIEKFIVARRLMYWQVYLHKTVLSAEFMLANIVKRAKWLTKSGVPLFASPDLKLFLANAFTMEDFHHKAEVLNAFAMLDDYDIIGAIKVWQDHPDEVLSTLCRKLLNRELFKVRLQKDPFSAETISERKDHIKSRFVLNDEDAAFFLIQEKVDNRAYSNSANAIRLKFKDGSIVDAADASDHLNLHALTQTVEKHVLCFPEY